VSESPPPIAVVVLALSLGVGLLIGLVRTVHALRLRPLPSFSLPRWRRRAPAAAARAPRPTTTKATRKASPDKTASSPAKPRGGFWSVANQLTWVRAAAFSSKPVMNKSEYQVFLLIEQLVQKRYRGCRLFAQTSLGEILGSSDQQAFKSINSKRIDMLIMGTDGYPAVAIEYQGTGHYQGDAEIRDAIKREALERAGIPLVEIFPQDRTRAIEDKVIKAMKKKRGRAANP